MIAAAGFGIVVRGRWALLVVGLVGLGAILNAVATRETLPRGGLEAIRRGLVAEYRLRRLSGVSLPEGATRRLEEDLRRFEAVSVDSVRAKGWGFSRIVRVEVTIGGDAPPDGRSVRYLQIGCGPVIECHVVNEVSRLKYLLGLWFVQPAVAGFPTPG